MQSVRRTICQTFSIVYTPIPIPVIGISQTGDMFSQTTLGKMTNRIFKEDYSVHQFGANIPVVGQVSYITNGTPVTRLGDMVLECRPFPGHGITITAEPSQISG